jgi:hypothetical protein
MATQLPPIGSEVPAELQPRGLPPVRPALPPLGAEVPPSLPGGALSLAEASRNRVLPPELRRQPGQPPPSAASPVSPPPQPFAGLGIETVSDEEWDRMTPGERMQGLLKAAGLAAFQMLGMPKPAATEAVEHPKTTLATFALPLMGKGIAAVTPTRAAAAQKFEEVMGAVGKAPVDVARPGDVALRVMELAERGGTMPKVVRDFLRRATDPDKASITYREMRDFYSNVSRLSADEMNRLPPIIKSQIGDLRVAMNEALARTAASGGKEGVYRAAMREYKVASRLRELATSAAKHGIKWGAGLVGAGAAYKLGKELLD